MANECSFGGEQGRHGRSTFFCGAKANENLWISLVKIMRRPFGALMDKFDGVDTAVSDSSRFKEDTPASRK